MITITRTGITSGHQKGLVRSTRHWMLPHLPCKQCGTYKIDLMQLLVDVMGTVLNVMFALVMNESTKIVFPNVLVLFSISLTELFLFLRTMQRSQWLFPPLCLHWAWKPDKIASAVCPRRWQSRWDRPSFGRTTVGRSDQMTSILFLPSPFPRSRARQ